MSNYIRRLPLLRRPAQVADPGEMVDLRMEDGSWREGFRALFAPSTLETGEVLVWVCTEDEYKEAHWEERRAVGMTWPVKRMRVSPSPTPGAYPTGTGERGVECGRPRVYPRGPGMCAVHPSAWKEYSANFVATILDRIRGSVGVAVRQIHGFSRFKRYRAGRMALERKAASLYRRVGRLNKLAWPMSSMVSMPASLPLSTTGRARSPLSPRSLYPSLKRSAPGASDGNFVFIMSRTLVNLSGEWAALRISLRVRIPTSLPSSPTTGKSSW